MKIYVELVASLILIIGLIAPLSGGDTEIPHTLPLKDFSSGQDTNKIRKTSIIDVDIDIKVDELQDGQVRIKGSTNLPPGTKLMLSVKEKSPYGFHGQFETSVLADGSFQGLFGPTNGLKCGVYIAEVVMPLPLVQPNHVRKIIGTNGEKKLSGPLVETGRWGVTASASNEFTIGNAQASKLQKERSQLRMKDSNKWLNKIVAIHKSLEKAHQKKVKGIWNDARWAQFARKFTNVHGRLRSKIMNMPVSIRVVLGEPLESVLQMFHSTAFENTQRYNEAHTRYQQGLKNLHDFISETEEKAEKTIQGGDALIITTKAGKTYKNCRVKRTDSEGITVFHSAGVAKIPFVNLPEKIRNTYKR